MSKKLFLFLVLAFFLVITLANLSSAAYISGKIKIYENGFARFDVETDVPINLEGLKFEKNKLAGTTSQLTQKQGDTWTFKPSLLEYKSILLDIELPKNLDSIISMKGNLATINLDNKVVTIVDSGPLNFEISYKLKNKSNYSWLLWLLAILIIIVAFIIYRKIRAKKERLEHILPIINENEQKIIDLLMKRPIRQKELRKMLNIPKASFSRYISNLEKKKLILREGEGKNKILRLK